MCKNIWHHLAFRIGSVLIIIINSPFVQNNFLCSYMTLQLQTQVPHPCAFVSPSHQASWYVPPRWVSVPRRWHLHPQHLGVRQTSRLRGWLWRAQWLCPKDLPPNSLPLWQRQLHLPTMDLWRGQWLQGYERWEELPSQGFSLSLLAVAVPGPQYLCQSECPL